jgi:hypothetical protein
LPIVKDISLFKKQIDFLQATERDVLLDAAIGFGKTKIGCLWLHMVAIQYPKSRWLMVARDVPQLRNAVVHEFLKVGQDWLGIEDGIHFEHNKSRNEFVYTNGSKIIGVGATNYDSAFRGPSYSGGLFDEVDYYKEEAFLALLGRIREPPELLRFVSSPKGFNHVHNYFYVNKNDTKKVINATTYDNPTLSNEYISALKGAYSPRLFEQEVLGKRLQINVGRVYNEFNRDIHVKNCRELLKDTDQLYFFTDYNIANYCGIYTFFRDGIVYAIGEEHLNYEGTRKMAENIYAKYAKDRFVIVCGDSAGNNKRDVAADKTNYEIFKEVLGEHCTKKVTNPPVLQRIIAANSNFYHKRLVIDPSCKNLIKDLELLAWKEDGKDIEKTIDLSHASDAFSYSTWFFLPIKPERRQSTSIQL